MFLFQPYIVYSSANRLWGYLRAPQSPQGPPPASQDISWTTPTHFWCFFHRFGQWDRFGRLRGRVIAWICHDIYDFSFFFHDFSVCLLVTVYMPDCSVTYLLIIVYSTCLGPAGRQEGPLRRRVRRDIKSEK